jgi:hypothetical protein
LATNVLYAIIFCPVRATRTAHFILLDFIILIMLGEEGPHCAVFSNLLSLYLSAVQIFSSAPYSLTLSV